MYGYGWHKYVPVHQRRAKAAKELEKMRKKGADVQPVATHGRTIAATFWGRAWCEHLEKFSDYENRLPRGRTYVRNGSVCHLDIQRGKIEARVIGSSLYTVKIAIKTLPTAKWTRVKKCCAGRVGSILELLQGKLSSEVMTVVTDRDDGLFPSPDEIELNCSCPDWADMCKHVAAVLYGVGARLDSKPELLFLLRGVDHNALVDAVAAEAVISKTSAESGRVLDNESLSDVFGIELAGQEPAHDTSGASPAAPPEAAQPKPAKARTRGKAAKPPSKPAQKKAKAKPAPGRKVAAKRSSGKRPSRGAMTAGEPDTQ